MARRKPVKYPKKFRMKLEQVANKRDERAARAAELSEEKPDDPSPFDTLWHDFLPKGSCHMMIGRIDEVQHRLYMTAYLQQPEPAPEPLFVSPPWGEEGASS